MLREHRENIYKVKCMISLKQSEGLHAFWATGAKYAQLQSASATICHWCTLNHACSSLTLRLHIPKKIRAELVLTWTFGTCFHCSVTIRQSGINSEMEKLRNDFGMCNRSLGLNEMFIFEESINKSEWITFKNLTSWMPWSGGCLITMSPYMTHNMTMRDKNEMQLNFWVTLWKVFISRKSVSKLKLCIL